MNLALAKRCEDAFRDRKHTSLALLAEAEIRRAKLSFALCSYDFSGASSSPVITTRPLILAHWANVEANLWAALICLLGC
jgi:hypothetical protein